jgi:hypothetical protein
MPSRQSVFDEFWMSAGNPRFMLQSRVLWHGDNLVDRGAPALGSMSMRQPNSLLVDLIAVVFFAGCPAE